MTARKPPPEKASEEPPIECASPPCLLSELSPDWLEPVRPAPAAPKTPRTPRKAPPPRSSRR